MTFYDSTGTAATSFADLANAVCYEMNGVQYFNGTNAPSAHTFPTGMSFSDGDQYWQATTARGTYCLWIYSTASTAWLSRVASS